MTAGNCLFLIQMQKSQRSSDPAMGSSTRTFAENVSCGRNISAVCQKDGERGRVASQLLRRWRCSFSFSLWWETQKWRWRNFCFNMREVKMIPARQVFKALLSDYHVQSFNLSWFRPREIFLEFSLMYKNQSRPAPTIFSHVFTHSHRNLLAWFVCFN